MGKFIVGITGASGSIYGKRVVEEFLRYGHVVFLTITRSGMVVVPCSMSSVSGVASGSSSNLLERAADVIIKESRPLVLVPRETPLSAIHLENLLKLARLGIKIVPPMPGFYSKPVY